MSKSPYFDADTNINKGYIELQTLPKSVRRRPSKETSKSQGVSKRNSGDFSGMSNPKKVGLKQRIFGNRRNSKGTPKHDVVRNVEITNYTPKTDRALKQSLEHDKEISKSAPWEFLTTVIMGHKMEQHQKPTWCDICEEFVWGLYTQAIRCQYCRYTCHSKCISYINLECPKAKTVEKSREDLTRETLEILSETDGLPHQKKENNNLPDFVSSLKELHAIIGEYNKQNSLIMTLHENCTFDGFIRVQMNLSRPVNISADTSNLTMKKAVMRTKSGRTKQNLLSESRRPLTAVFDGDLSSADEDSGIDSRSSTSSTLTSVDSARLSSRNNLNSSKRPSRRLSFYLPKGTYKPLHVTSTTTAREVIEALLSKYSVTDNPKKYALFEKNERKIDAKETEVTYKRLLDDDKPLALRLSWGAKCHTKAFALKENEDGTIQWMNFEIPELNNFLKILQIEEDELLAQIYHKYEVERDVLQRAIDDKRVLTVTSSDIPTSSSPTSSNC